MKEGIRSNVDDLQPLDGSSYLSKSPFNLLKIEVNRPTHYLHSDDLSDSFPFEFT